MITGGLEKRADLDDERADCAYRLADEVDEYVEDVDGREA